MNKITRQEALVILMWDEGYKLREIVDQINLPTWKIVNLKNSALKKLKRSRRELHVVPSEKIA